MTINDYIKSPHDAVRAGYNPSYLTKVSAVFGRGYSIEQWRRHMPSLSVDDSLRDLSRSLITWLIFMACLISLPVTAWVIALVMPGNQIKQGDE